MIVAQQSIRPAYRNFYTVAGRLLCVVAHDRRSSDLYEKFFAGFYFELMAGDEMRDADVTLRIHAGDDMPPIPHGLKSFEVASGGLCFQDGARYFLQEANSLALISNASAPSVDVWISPDVVYESASTARLVFNTTMAALRLSQRFELHGGAVVEPESGEGILIVGPSGSGKSTLTTQLAAHGWGYLSDDSLLLYRAVDEISACGLRRVFSVTEKTIAAGISAKLQKVTTAPVPFDPDKRRFIPQDIFPDGALEICAPRALCFPVISHEPQSRTRKLSQYEAMAQLLKMSPWSCYDQLSAREHLKVLAGLSRQAAAFELSAGDDLLGNTELTSTFFSSLLREQGT